MKKITLLLLWIAGLGLQAQIQQNINTTSGSISNAISEIDSIRFNAASGEMQVVFLNGNVESHTLNTIDSVTFGFSPNSLAHTCGADSVHNPALTYGSMTDQQGNVYKTIVIGTQEWMAENLKTAIYRNGDAIENVTDNAQWQNLTTGAYCSYNNNSQFDCPYGKLYNWHAAADARNVCPTGWHVPTDTEWSDFINYLDPNADGGNNGNIAGSKLKSTGLQYWISPNQGATNESGFSGLPAGLRLSNGTFGFNGNNALYWSSTEVAAPIAWYRFLDYSAGYAHRDFGYDKSHGFSLRCVRD